MNDLLIFQAHANCYKSLPAECNFGSLREILLPPSCLTIPRMDISTEVMLGINMKGSKSPTHELGLFDTKWWAQLLICVARGSQRNLRLTSNFHITLKVKLLPANVKFEKVTAHNKFQLKKLITEIWT